MLAQQRTILEDCVDTIQVTSCSGFLNQQFQITHRLRWDRMPEQPFCMSIKLRVFTRHFEIEGNARLFEIEDHILVALESCTKRRGA